MEGRRNEFDVTNRVDVTNPDAVCKEVCTLFSDMYPKISTRPVSQAFHVVSKLFLGELPGYHPCDTPYHDLQHTLDVSLTMARLLYGHERAASRSDRLGAELTRLGIIVALFHDAGYIRRLADRHHRNGAEYTTRHVTRSGRFLAKLLPEIGLEELVPVARRLVHFTGYEMAIHAIPLRDPAQRTLGKLLGSADLMAQMADRCYLEKCKSRLYPEFVAAGMAGPGAIHGGYQSAEELMYKTPKFFQHVLQDRLENVLMGVHNYAESFFMPQRNKYKDALEKNCSYLNLIIKEQDLSLLRRQPPWTLAIDQEQLLLTA